MLALKGSCRRQGLFNPTKALIISAACLVFYSQLSMAHPHDTTLRQTLEDAIKTQPDTITAHAQEEESHARLRQAQGQFLPSVDADYANGYENTDNPATRDTTGGNVELNRREAGVRMDQLLYDGGRVWNEVKERKYEVSSAKHASHAARENVALEVSNAYINVIRFRHVLAIAREDVASHKRTLAKIEKRVKGGAGRKSELQLSRARLSEAQARLDTARTELANANHTFRDIVGYPAPAALTSPRVRPTLIPANLNTVQKVAMQNNPSLREARAELKASNSAVATAQAEYFPRVDVELSADRDDELDGVKGRNDQDLALVRVSYNLFRGGQDHARVRETVQQRVVAQQTIERVRRQVVERSSSAWTDMVNTKSKVRALQAHVTHSRHVVESYKKEFSLGQRSLLNVLDAENEYFRARTDLATGKYQLKLSKYRVLESMGTLEGAILSKSA